MKSGNMQNNRLVRTEDLFEPELQNLMTFKIRRVLLVASLYDYFLLEEDGRLVDLLGAAYNERDLGYVPTINQVSNGSEALEALETDEFDLVITHMRLDDMEPFDLGEMIKKDHPELPVVLLAFNTPQLEEVQNRIIESSIDMSFLWQGDGKILVAIIKYIEDMKNAQHDTEIAGVQNIILLESSIRFYSTNLLTIYEELWNHIEQMLKLELTYTQKKMRQRKRPRIHLATSFEEGMRVYEMFKDNLMGVIASESLNRNGKRDKTAGIDFAGKVREENHFLPILLLTNGNEKAEIADKLRAGYLVKRSPTLPEEFKQSLIDYFYFGDLILRDENGNIKSRVSNLKDLAKIFDKLDIEIISRYMDNGEISRWLKARTETNLAKKIERINHAEYNDSSRFRAALRNTLREHRRETHRGSIIRYSKDLFKDISRFSLIGSGSIGGKARGLAFIDKVLNSYIKEGDFPEVDITIPRTVVIGTDVFEEFMKENNLFEFSYSAEHTEEEITKKFLNCTLPSSIRKDLKDYAANVKVPLAVRSSSLLEDSLYQPFAGVYATKMLPNDGKKAAERYRELEKAVKLVYASTFFPNAKAYIKHTPSRIEDEKMAVIIQEVVGKRHDNHFYPHFSGVARSYNYYPVGKARPEDGVANLAIGLGKTVVDGGITASFSPRYPKVLAGIYSTEDMLNNTQKNYWAIRMGRQVEKTVEDEDQYLEKLDLLRAEKDGILDFTGSTYSRENNTIYDGISRPGARVVSYASILKYDVMPLARIIEMLLRLGQKAMGCPVEIEFAVTLGRHKALPAEFGLLQVKPLVSREDLMQVDISDYDEDLILARSPNVLGNGIIEDIEDIIYVKPDEFDASTNPEIAKEVSELNREFNGSEKHYLLIGPGRWGSSEPWLGVPVKWGDINNAKVIIEASLENMNPDASQGSHFFQNITSLGLGYFTVRLNIDNSLLRWNWLAAQKAVKETKHLRHVILDRPIKIFMDGKKGVGIILKPGTSV